MALGTVGCRRVKQTHGTSCKVMGAFGDPTSWPLMSCGFRVKKPASLSLTLNMGKIIRDSICI